MIIISPTQITTTTSGQSSSSSSSSLPLMPMTTTNMRRRKEESSSSSSHHHPHDEPSLVVSGRMEEEGEDTPLLLAAPPPPPFEEDTTTTIISQPSSSTLWGFQIASWMERLVPGLYHPSPQSHNHHHHPTAATSSSSISWRDAWRRWEYYVLPRRRRTQRQGDNNNDNDNNDTVWEKASPGDNDDDTELYPAWTTPPHALNDFGTGVAVYFETLRWMAWILVLGGILYLPSIFYYASNGYEASSTTTTTTSRSWGFFFPGPLQGSWMCSHVEWVPCPTCTREDFSQTLHRLGHATMNHRTTKTTTTAESSMPLLLFAWKNQCAPLQWNQGIHHLMVMCVMAACIFALGKYQEQLELEYDESVLTARDFSIQVDNPPLDAWDPQEWQDFFQPFGEIAMVTVSLNNSNLLEALTKRRILLQKAAYHTTSMDNDGDRQSLNPASIQDIPPEFQSKAPKLYQKLIKINERCRQLLHTSQNYPVSAVFVTFQKEASQRQCLQTLQVGQIHVEQNNTHVFAASPHYLFRKVRVLDVLEPPEPSAIRWQDLDESTCRKVGERMVTGSLTVAVIVASFRLVEYCFEQQAMQVAAIVITLLNIVMPKVFIAMNRLESHQSEGSYQASLYTKICIFRWVNTGVVTILIKNFSDFLSDRPDALIASVHAVLRAEIVLAPLVHLADIGGNLQRHLLAPLLAKNQADMNRYFRGSPQNLGEKYTNATKTVFLVFFYSAIFPSGFFYGAMALFLTYWTDKFSLLRSWAPMPQLGDHVALLSRKVFFPLTLVVLALLSQLFYTAYPCDNLCETGSLVSSQNNNHTDDYIGSHTVQAMDENPTTYPNVTITEGDALYEFCDQDFLSLGFGSYFFEDHSEWMPREQIQMSHVFGLFSIGVMVGWIITNYRDAAKLRAEALGGFSTTERDSRESYSDQPKIQAYVPQIPHQSFDFPLIAASTRIGKDFDSRFVGWKDPLRNHQYYDLSQDVAALRGHDNDDDSNDSNAPPVLARIRQYCQTS